MDIKGWVGNDEKYQLIRFLRDETNASKIEFLENGKIIATWVRPL
jgi:hypothetical protein